MVQVIADLPPAENVPLNGVPTGARNPEWQPFKPATIVWLDALDGGDPEKNVPFRDQVLSLPAPFSGKAREIARTAQRLEIIEWLGRLGLALLTESDWKRRWRTTWLMDTEQAGKPPKKIFDLSENDQYNDPGNLVTVVSQSGETIGRQRGNSIYLSGQGSSPQGDRPFLDQFNLKTLTRKRLFQSGAASYDRFIDYAGNSGNRVIISAESKNEPPNLYLFDLEARKRMALTDFKDPASQLTGMKKEIIKYKRDDGIELSGTLYLPPGYKQGQKLPVVIWAYPMEYSDAATAGQIRGSANRFTFFRGTSQLFFVTQGYAVLDNATMPVIGDPKTMNDTFVQQIVASARAAIDTLDTRGVGDRNRVGIGGHSYGAFMTANLLAHSDLFAAGIARSGAYNRTLTPFGFQSERRTLWEAPEAYIKVSPFMHADKIKKPILLIHGEADNNSGTFPIQSERLFSALKGLGGTARLVLLPHESHGYSARESVMDVLAEMFTWFDMYVKNKK
jgi:dipeptidyl aminopeptidase/acylaminoacyl peptidase